MVWGPFRCWFELPVPPGDLPGGWVGCVLDSDGGGLSSVCALWVCEADLLDPLVGETVVSNGAAALG